MNSFKLKMITAICLMFAVLSGQAFASGNADGDKHVKDLSISQVSVDFDSGEIYIQGSNLVGKHNDPRVALAGSELAVSSATDTLIIAYLDPGTLPGDYLLTVTAGMGETKRGSYDLTIGAVGPQGPQGDVGPQGPKGDKGDKGDKGNTGAQGPRGYTGFKGDKGDKGGTGAQGPKGDKGNTGARGPAGTLAQYTRTLYTSTSGGGYLSTIHNEVYCSDKNDIAVGGSVVETSARGNWRPDSGHNQTVQDPNQTSHHRHAYICNGSFLSGCGSFNKTLTVTCLTVP